VAKIAGVFHILAAGIGAGIVIVSLELLYRAKADSVRSGGEVGGIEDNS